MNALDTNILVRYITQDIPEQAAIAERLLDSLTNSSSGFISREVVIELVWVLERSYKFSRAQVVEVLTTLIGAENLIVESEEDIARATFMYEQSGTGFSDVAILMASERAGCENIYTFDRRFARMEGVTLLTEDFSSTGTELA